MDSIVRGNVLQTDLKSQGILDFGKLQHRSYRQYTIQTPLELFFDDKPMTLARWPNEGQETVVSAQRLYNGDQKFIYRGDRPSRWGRANDIWMNGYWANTYAQTYQHVVAIDTVAHTITLGHDDRTTGDDVVKRTASWYALNLLEELDHPGEWFLDRDTGILYFWPPTPIEGARVTVSINEKPFVSMQDVSYVKLKGLTFEDARGHGLSISRGMRVVIEDCVIRNIGMYAVLISGGQQHGVVGCHISGTGTGGIRLSGGDRKTLRPAEHYATDNDIHHLQRWITNSRPAVWVLGVGNTVANNHIHDVPGSAIFISGNNHTVEYNHIHHVVQEIDDGGAIYSGFDWTNRGNVIRYNYIHNIGRRRARQTGIIYLDDYASGFTVYGNIFAHAKRGVLIGGGRDNTIENNVFVDCTPAVWVDARGLNYQRLPGYEHRWKGAFAKLRARLNAVPYREPPWSEQYPELFDYPGENPAMPTGNVIVRNVFHGGRWLDLVHGLTTDIITVEDNWTEGDPLFVDEQRQEFQLRDDSPVWQLGFQKIDISKIGPRK